MARTGVRACARTCRHAGTTWGRHRVARLMRQARLCGSMKKRYRVPSGRRAVGPVARNVLNRDFSPREPNQVWAGDITYVRTDEGWLYLAVVLDLYSRRVVGWSMQARIGQDLVVAALTMALWQRQPRPGLLHHSDRGSQAGFKGSSQHVLAGVRVAVR